MTKEMTQGRPIRLILAFCLPLICGNLFQQLYSMVDSIIVGQFIGVEALAAVGSTGSVNFLVLGFATGLCSGFAIPIAQAFGARSLEKMRSYVANAAFLSFGAAVIMTGLTLLTTRPLLELMQTPSDIIDGAYAYIIVIFAGIGATVLYNLLSAILRSLGDSRTPLIFLIIASLLNVVLDLFCILVLKMGVAGAAWATVISQGVSGLLCLGYIARKLPLLHLKAEDRHFQPQLCADLFKVGVPMALQFSITAIGSIVIQSAVNSLGSATVAAITAANKIQMMVTQPLETIGITMATFCGQNLGAGQDDRIHLGIRQSLILSLGYSAVSVIIIALAGRTISLLFISGSETAILDQIQQYLQINSYFYFMLGILFIFRNSLQGMGYSVAAMLAGAFEMAACCFVAFVLVRQFHFAAVCFSNPCAWSAAVALLITVYLMIRRDLGMRCAEARTAQSAMQTAG